MGVGGGVASTGGGGDGGTVAVSPSLPEELLSV